MEDERLHVAIEVYIYWKLFTHAGNRVLADKPLPVQEGYADAGIGLGSELAGEDRQQESVNWIAVANEIDFRLLRGVDYVSLAVARDRRAAAIFDQDLLEASD